MVPVNELCSVSQKIKFESASISEGIVPLSEFSLKFHSFNREREPILVGIVP